MGRSRRPLAAGLTYHVTARGNAKAPTFLTDADYAVFLSGLTIARHLDGLLCHAYCLMENHYHLLVETPRANLDDAMHRLNSTYAIRFNRHHERTGHVFQGRYGAKLRSLLADAVRLRGCAAFRAGTARLRPLRGRGDFFRSDDYGVDHPGLGPSWSSRFPMLVTGSIW